MVHRMVEAMSQLQEEKARLQEELAALQERLALRDSDQQATSTQLQNQVPGEDGMGRGHSPAVEQIRGHCVGRPEPTHRAADVMDR